MKEKFIVEVINRMAIHLNNGQLEQLQKVLIYCLTGFEVTENQEITNETRLEERYRQYFFAN